MIEGHTPISTKMWQEHNIHLGQNISTEAGEEICSSSDAGRGKMLGHWHNIVERNIKGEEYAVKKIRYLQELNKDEE